MFPQVLRFVRLPLVLILIYAVLRFLNGPVFGTPYAPRGNAMFSVVGLTFVSCVIWGALSRKVGGFRWLGTALVGLILGLWSQILIFAATAISYAANLNTYYIHWDALNVAEGTTVTMAKALTTRASGLIFGPLFSILFACIGRLLFGPLAPAPRAGD